MQQRKLYKLNEWLIKDEFKNLTSQEYANLQLLIMTEMNRRLFTEDLYSLIEPTEFAKRTILNPVYINSNSIKKIYILSRNITTEQAKSKKEFIEKYFNHNKIEYIEVKDNQSKADVLINKKIDFNLLVDDEIPNIRDIAEKFKSLEKKEFLIPEYGYNKITPDLKLLIEGKGRYNIIL